MSASRSAEIHYQSGKASAAILILLLTAWLILPPVGSVTAVFMNLVSQIAIGAWGVSFPVYEAIRYFLWPLRSGICAAMFWSAVLSAFVCIAATLRANAILGWGGLGVTSDPRFVGWLVLQLVIAWLSIGVVSYLVGIIERLREEFHSLDETP